VKGRQKKMEGRKKGRGENTLQNKFLVMAFI